MWLVADTVANWMPVPASNHNVAAKKAVGVAEQDRLTSLRPIPVCLGVVFTNEGGIAERVYREVDRGVDVARLQCPTSVEIQCPGAGHAVGHQLQFDRVDLIPRLWSLEWLDSFPSPCL